MDLTQFSMTETVRLPIYHPMTNEPLEDKDGPVAFEIRNTETPQVRGARHSALQARFQDPAFRDNPENPFSAENVDADSLDMLVAATAGWEGVVVDGVNLECTPENVRMVYKRFPFIRRQVEMKVNDDRTFMGNSEETS